MHPDTWLQGLGIHLRDQIRFLLEVDRLKTVVRGSRVADGSRRENSAEHSWHIALFALVLAEHARERVDPLRVITMLLIHDVVEIDAGDTPLFDSAATVSQHERERIAALRIFGLLPKEQRDAYLALWREFEAAETPDAKFGKACDRLLPILLNHAVHGGTWQDYHVDERRERSLTSRIAEGSPALWSVAEAAIEDAVRNGWLRSAND